MFCCEQICETCACCSHVAPDQHQSLLVIRGAGDQHLCLLVQHLCVSGIVLVDLMVVWTQREFSGTCQNQLRLAVPGPCEISATHSHRTANSKLSCLSSARSVLSARGLKASAQSKLGVEARDALNVFLVAFGSRPFSVEFPQLRSHHGKRRNVLFIWWRPLRCTPYAIPENQAPLRQRYPQTHLCANGKDHEPPNLFRKPGG